MRAAPLVVVAAVLGTACTAPEYDLLPEQAPPPSVAVVWAARFGDANDQLIKAAAVDSNGDLVIAGDLLGAIPELGGILSPTDTLPFVAKLSPDGALRWSRVIDGSGSFAVADVDVSAETGAIVVAGAYKGGWIESERGELPSHDGESDDAFLTLLAPDGELLWTRHLTGRSAQRATRVRFYPDGRDERRIALVGDFTQGICVEDPGGTSCFPASDGSFEAFLASIGDDGLEQALRVLGGPGEQHAAALAIDGRRAIVAGTNDGSIALERTVLETNGSTDVFVAKLDLFDHATNPLWSASFGSAEPNCYEECELAATVDQAERTIVAGTLNGELDLGGGTLFASPLAPDLFLAAYRTQPVDHLWSRQIGGGSGEVRPYGIATRLGDETVVTGLFKGTFDPGLGPLESGDAARDGFALGFDADGALIWSVQVAIAFEEDDPKPPPPLVVAVEPGGDVYLAGSFRGALRCGGAMLEGAGALGGYDLFVVKLSP